MTAETLAMITGVVLSLLASYIPGVKSWFENLSPSLKQSVMGIALIIVAAAIMGLVCSGYGADLGIAVTCDRAGIIGFVRVLIMALIANQSTYLITKS